MDDAIWITEKVISKAESDWMEAMPLLEQLQLKPQLVNFRAWLWASATISSRTFHIPWNSAGGLCPVGDLFNYAAPGEELAAAEVCESWLGDSLSFQSGGDKEDPLLDAELYDAWSDRLTDGGYDEDVAAYCLYAKKNYKNGEQVLLRYGIYTNLELLEHYGFVLDVNPNDKVFIPLPHDISACHSWPADSLYIQHNGKPSFALLSALRLWVTPPKQRKSVGYLALSGSQISLENDKKVMKWLLSNCRALLNSLPSTIEDDQSLLGAIDKAQQLQSFEKPINMPYAATMEYCKFLDLCCGGSDVLALSSKVKRSMDRWKLAVQWRLRYKKTLVYCISFCSQAIETLHCKWREMENF